jgi:hypothetical protein
MCIAKKLVGKPVMIRTYSAGVHYGILNEVESTEGHYDVELVNSRRIYSWVGAFTLSELATKGSEKNEGNKFSVTIPSIFLKGIEIIEMTDNGFKNLNSVENFKIQ